MGRSLTSMPRSVTAPRPRPRDPRPLRRIRTSARTALVWGVPAAAFTVVFVGLGRLFGMPVEVYLAPDAQPVALGPLILIAATLFAALLAGVAVGVLGRLLRKPVPWILAGGVVVTLASLSAPLGQPDQIGAVTKAVLCVCHVVTGLLVTVGLTRGMIADDRVAG